MIDCEFDTLILSLVLIWIFYVFNFILQLSKLFKKWISFIFFIKWFCFKVKILFSKVVMIPFPMLFGYIIFVVLPRKCTIPIISFWLRFPSILAVVGLLDAFSVFGCPIANLCQGLVVVGIGVDIGISTVPNESSFLFEAVWRLFQTTLIFCWVLTQPTLARNIYNYLDFD